MKGRELGTGACRGHWRNDCWGRGEVVKGPTAPRTLIPGRGSKGTTETCLSPSIPKARALQNRLYCPSPASLWSRGCLCKTNSSGYKGRHAGCCCCGGSHHGTISLHWEVEALFGAASLFLQDPHLLCRAQCRDVAGALGGAWLSELLLGFHPR